jgi:hypothetical protein
MVITMSNSVKLAIVDKGKKGFSYAYELYLRMTPEFMMEPEHMVSRNEKI